MALGRGVKRVIFLLRSPQFLRPLSRALEEKYQVPKKVRICVQIIYDEGCVTLRIALSLSVSACSFVRSCARFADVGRIANGTNEFIHNVPLA